MSVDLGPVRVLGADAVGRPGERRFRLFAQSMRGSAFMWMEKEQLNDLSLALDRALALITEGEVLRTEASTEAMPQPESLPMSFPSQPTYDFQVGQIRLNYDNQDGLFLLNVLPLEILMERDQEPQMIVNEEDMITFSFTQDEARRLSLSITSVVSAGRPVCPLCHMPLDRGPHACVKQNGHREILQVEDEEDE